MLSRNKKELKYFGNQKLIFVTAFPSKQDLKSQKCVTATLVNLLTEIRGRNTRKCHRTWVFFQMLK